MIGIMMRNCLDMMLDGIKHTMKSCSTIVITLWKKLIKLKLVRPSRDEMKIFLLLHGWKVNEDNEAWTTDTYAEAYWTYKIHTIQEAHKLETKSLTR
jgi:hypothetical protein